jgi:pimeloyl-ACP methyl ester carboxylesterase
LPRGEAHAVPLRGELFVRLVDGPPAGGVALLIHGWQATADLNFHPLFASLGQSHRVIAPDLRGHGRSLYPEEPFTLEDAADDLAALLVDLGIESATLVGYSIGTAVAQTMAHRHPGLVAGMVLIGGELAPRTRPHEKVYDRLGDWLGTGLRLTNGRWAAHRLVSKAARETPDVERLRGWLVQEIERGHPASLRAAGRALARFDGRPMAEARSEIPVVAVITRRDRLVRPARQERLAAAWRAEIVDLDADHDAPLAQPEAFNRAVQDALQLLAEVRSA